jgi:hypothetical protein
MKILPSLAILLAAPLAAADPAPCDVDVVRAPDDARPIIEDWVRREPRCGRSLRVRVIATEGGLYVIAQEPNGRTHERTVPDAQTAAVLIASWAADDETRPERPPAPLEPAVSAPGSAPPPVVVAASAPAPAPWSRIVDIGGMYALVNDGTSLRIGIDLVRVARVNLGVAVARQTTSFPLDNGDPPMRTTDLRFVVRGAVERAWSSLAFRAELGAGVMRISDDMPSYSVGSVVEGSLTVGGWVTHNWRVRGGPLLSTVPDASLASGILRGGLDLRLWLGVDRRL